MKNYIVKIIFLFSSLSVNAQVTIEGNTSPGMNTDYVGWASTVTNPLRIKHEGNYGIEFYTNTGAGTFGTPKMELESTGQLGLGTTTPSSWFHLVRTGASGTIAEEPLRTVVPASQIGNWRMYRGTDQMMRLWHGSSGNALFFQSPQGHMNFGSGHNGTVTPTMQIMGGGTASTLGNVLIGDYTSFSPSSLFHVKGRGYDV